MLFIFLLFSAFVLFFSTVQYTRLQWITGIRYIVPVIPFLFLPTVVVLIKMPRICAYGFGIIALVESWSMSMVRRVDIPDEGILDNLTRFFLEGFQLPWLNTLSRMSIQYIPFLKEHSILPLPIFLASVILIYGIWRVKLPWDSLGKDNAL